MDDFSGSCMGQKFPLIHAAKDELKGYKVANLDAQSSNINSAYGQAIGEHNLCIIFANILLSLILCLKNYFYFLQCK